jgi:hypothetical protein
MTTRATGRYKELHELTAAQQVAAGLIAAGDTHSKAAEAVGVHRVTVTRWAMHHPAFVAEVNRIRSDARRAMVSQMDRITSAALSAIEIAVGSGDVASALKWLRIVSLEELIARPIGALESTSVVASVRASMPSSLLETLTSLDGRSTSEAEAWLLTRLQAPIDGAEG